MKILSFTTLSAGITTATLLAIEAPTDDAPPPMEVPAVGQAPAAEAPANQQAAYLGVVAGSIPEMLAAHIGLQAGEGIVVRALMPDGPALEAGLAVHDVITRIGGEPLASSEDLTREINSLQPGEKVRLDVIHKGKPVGIDVTLGTRPLQVAAPQIRPLEPLDQLNLDGVPQDLADRVRRMIEGNLGDQRLDFRQGIHEPAPQFEEAMREMKLRMEKAMEGMQIPELQQRGGIQIPEFQQQGGIQVQQGATFRLMDNEGSIELKSNHGGKEITVRDKDQQIVWSGPWDTEQDKAAAPEDIRQRVERLNFDANGNGLRLQFRNNLKNPRD